MKLTITNAEALVVGPDEVLIIRLPENSQDEGIELLLEHLKSIGLEHRSLVFSGEVEFAKVQRAPEDIPPDYADSAE